MTHKPTCLNRNCIKNKECQNLAHEPIDCYQTYSAYVYDNEKGCNGFRPIEEEKLI